MEYIQQHIGPNKVSINIRNSPFYERSDGFEYKRNGALGGGEPAIDLMEMYKGHATVQKGIKENEEVKVFVSKEKEVPTDQLLFNLMKIVDPLLSLYKSAEDINNKIAKFKEELIKNLTNFHGMYKRLLLHKQYKLEQIIEAIGDTSLEIDKRKPLVVYICRLVDNSVMIISDDEKVPYLIKCGQKCKVLNVNTKEHNVVLDMEDYNTDEKYAELMVQKVIKYKKEGILEKIAQYNVKELRCIAEDLDVPVHTEEDGHKKLCLKPELKARIVKKIETHNT